MRIDEVSANNRDIQRKCRLNTEEGRQMATLSVLTDISETLAILTDLYGIVHGRVVSRSESENAQ